MHRFFDLCKLKAFDSILHRVLQKIKSASVNSVS